jgi:hypothetical protein
MRVGPEKPTRNIGGEINEPMKRDPIRRRGQTRLNMKAERIPPHGIPAARLHSPHAAEALQSLRLSDGLSKAEVETMERL